MSTKARELAELSRTIIDTSDATAITINANEEVTLADDLFLADGKKAIFGAGSDLQIYHSGAASFISDQGTGHLKILAGDFRLNNAADDAQFISAVNGAEVNLYHNNVARLSTSATGVAVTGTLSATGVLTVIDGSTSAPSISNAGDSNSGIYFPADDELGLLVGGSRKLHVTSSGVAFENGDLTVSGTLNGITTTQSVSGNRWGVLPEVASNGVMEIGRYLDFHTTDGDTSDYGARFDYDGSKMILTSAFETQSTIKSSANISIEAASGNPQLLVKTAGAGNNPNIRIQADSNYWDIQTLFSNADDELDFRYNGSSKLIIDKDGLVGIGNSSPSSYYSTFRDLVIGDGSGDHGITIATGTSGSGTLAIADGTSGNTAYRAFCQYSNNTDKLFIGAGGGTKLTVQGSDGSLGIGTTSPSFTAVSGSTSQKGLHIQNSGNDTSAHLKLTGHNNTGTPGQATDFEIIHRGDALQTIFRHGGADALILDSSSNLLIGTTVLTDIASSGTGNEGAFIKADGSSGFATSNQTVMTLNRKTSNGDVFEFRKDGTVIGSIGIEGGDSLYIQSDGASGGGLRFHNNGGIAPMRNGSLVDNVVDLGTSTKRFKDLFLSGDISIVGGSSGGTITVDPTSGDAELLLQGAAGAQTLRLDQNSIRTTTNSSLAIFTNNLSNRRIHIQNSTSDTTQHLVGIGTSSPQAALDINGSYNVNNTSDAIFRVLKNNGNDWSIRAEAGSDDYAYIAIGNGSYAYYVYNQPASAGRGRWNYNGEIYLNGGSSAIFNINSDVRLKEEISDAPSQWELIKGLPLQRFKWIDRREGDKWSYGFIAQEVEKTNPEFVELVPQDKEDADNGVEDPEYKTVAEGQIHERALAALQEAMRRIEALEAEVKALKGG